MTVKHLNISPNQKVRVYVETIVINKYAGKYAINQAYEDKYGEIDDIVKDLIVLEVCARDDTPIIYTKRKDRKEIKQ